MNRKVFIDGRLALSTRLEALAMGFLISEYYGHEVCLDWTELESFRVIGARIEKCGPWDRLRALRLRDYSPELFYRIAGHERVRLRTHQGPAHLLSRLYLPTAQRVKLRPDLIQVIRDTFQQHAGRPVVGVHIERDSTRPVDPDEVDVTAVPCPVLPEWWYEHVMQAIQAAFPNVAFFVSCAGGLAEIPHLTKNFDVFDLPTSFLPTSRDLEPAAHRQPVADLFALGCCSLIIGTPCSTFTHYAAHMLGEPSTVLVPPAHKICRVQPAFSQVNLYGRSALDWTTACRQGTGLAPVRDTRMALRPGPAWLDWM